MSKALLFSLGIPGMSFLIVTAAAAESLPNITTLLVPAVVILLLVALNGLFVTAEFSIIGVRPTQLEQLAEDGNTAARSVLEIINSRAKQDQYIATAQLGITIASLGLAMYGEPAIGHFIEPYLALLMGGQPNEVLVASLGYIIALSLLTYMHVVLGEMVPKTLTLDDAARIVLFIVRPMQVAEKILGVPVHLLNVIGRLLLR
ncbi:MAG: CNNM domain-containing protein, partial [Anaerolineae bacterium]